VLGSAPASQPGISNEELRVPIFTVPGNHDYRKHPYLLHFKVHLSEPVIDQIPITTLSNYESHNLTQHEAIALDNGGRPPQPFGIPVELKPSLRADEAAEMVEVDKANLAYFDYVNDSSNYLISLGKHRIAMLNTKYDVGIVDTEGEGLAHFFGYSDEDEDQFTTGSPNSVGITQDDAKGLLSDPLEVLKKALTEAAETKGTVIVGLHAPPFNISGNENAYYFLEKQHDTAEWQEVLGFLVL
jgi:hypothetical protein